MLILRLLSIVWSKVNRLAHCFCLLEEASRLLKVLIYVPRRLFCSSALVRRQTDWIVGSLQKQVNAIFVQLIYLYSLDDYDRFLLLLEVVSHVDLLIFVFFLLQNIFPLLNWSGMNSYFTLPPVYNLLSDHVYWIPCTIKRLRFRDTLSIDRHSFFSFDFFWVATFRGAWHLLIKLRFRMNHDLMFFAIGHGQLLLDDGFLDWRDAYLMLFVESHAMSLSVGISHQLFSDKYFLRRSLHLRLLRNLAAKLEHYHLAHVIFVIICFVIALIWEDNFVAQLIPRVCLVRHLVD